MVLISRHLQAGALEALTPSELIRLEVRQSELNSTLVLQSNKNIIYIYIYIYITSEIPNPVICVETDEDVEVASFRDIMTYYDMTV